MLMAQGRAPLAGPLLRQAGLDCWNRGSIPAANDDLPRPAVRMQQRPVDRPTWSRCHARCSWTNEPVPRCAGVRACSTRQCGLCAVDLAVVIAHLRPGGGGAPARQTPSLDGHALFAGRKPVYLIRFSTTRRPYALLRRRSCNPEPKCLALVRK